ncbi:tetratricopeptide repeat protein [Glycomyces rhizosphaerae]|uniref:Tetratricopeptide repeat protein n=1 Tax=Glycomyces rhizosphaerae TaxID=2054422 RepID=A0ABV7Q876_9ACTN
MTGDIPSLQDVLRQRQPHDFVGRGARLAEFGANLALPLADPDRRFIVNLHGVAGVGKTFLAQQYRRLAESKGAVCAYVDEDCFDIVETMAAVAADFDLQQVRMPGFETQLATYRQRRHELESDPKAPIGDLVTSTTVRMSMSMMKTVPVAGMAAEVMDPDAVANQLNRLRHYLGQRFSKRADIDLLLKPVEVLSKAFVAGLNDLAEERPVVLFFDTFERTAPFLETWLLDLFGGRFGNLTANLVTTIGGQHPLSSSGWMPLRSLIATHPLEPFTEEEARDFLARRGVSEANVVKVILGLSGRIPMWMATLAEKNPQDPGSVLDPSEGAVQRFLKWEPDLERQNIAKTGALPRRFNRDILAAAVGSEADVETLFGWLCLLPFVSRSSEHWRYHDAVRDPMVRLSRTTSPQQWRETNQRLADFFTAERAALGLSEEDGWADAGWQNLLIEEHYHRLCAAPNKALAAALELAASSTVEGISLARRWTAMLTSAGAAADSEQVQGWGRRLTELLQGEEADIIALLTELIERAKLRPEGKAIALSIRGEARRKQEQFALALTDFDQAVNVLPDRPRLHRRRGAIMRGLGRFSEALTDFDRSIALDPDDGQSHAERGETYRLMGRDEEAIADLDRAVALDPGNDWAIASRAAVYEKSGRFEEALADFNRVIELDPDYAWAIAKRGVTFQSLGRFEEALADFNRAIELDPDDAWNLTARAAAYRSVNRDEEALADLGRAIELGSENGWTSAERGAYYQSLHRYEEALTDFNRAIEIKPDYSWAITQRGRVYEAVDRYEDALADYSRAIELDPKSRLPIALRGSMNRELERHEDALSDFDRALAIDSDIDWVLAERGATHRALGQYEAAFTDFDRAIELDPEYQWAIAQRGGTYQQLKRYEEALADFDRAVELDPADDVVIAMRGSVYRSLGRYEEALADFDRAVELDPEYQWAIAMRGSVYRYLIRYEEALTDLDRAIELDPGADWVLAERGYAHQALNHYEEALLDLDRAIELDPDYEWAISVRGYVQLRNGRYAEALADLDRAAELDPSSSWTRFLKACVLRLQGDEQQHRREILAAIELVLAEAQAEPDDAVHKFNLIVCRIAQGQAAASREILGDLMSAAPADLAIIEFLEDLELLCSLPGIDLVLVAELEARARTGLGRSR